MDGADTPGDVTLASYDAAATVYRDHENRSVLPPPLVDFLDRTAAFVGRGGRVLELGSGPGRDARELEARGLQVDRTDGSRAFVAMLRADGHAARQLDIRSDDFGRGYDAVFADAVLLHLSREDFPAALGRARRAVGDGGLLAITLKEGDGEAWSNAKLDRPRHFTFWKEPAVRVALQETGWVVLSIDHVAGLTEGWLFVFARAVVRR